MTICLPPLSPEQQYKGPVATATNKGPVAIITMDPWVISSLNAFMVIILKLKGSENYKIWAWEVDTAFALYPEYSDALLRDSDNESIKWITITCLIHSLESMIASALDSKEEFCRMALKELWKIIEREYSNTPFDTKWNFLTEL